MSTLLMVSNEKGVKAMIDVNEKESASSYVPWSLIARVTKFAPLGLPEGLKL